MIVDFNKQKFMRELVASDKAITRVDKLNDDIGTIIYLQFRDNGLTDSNGQYLHKSIELLEKLMYVGTTGYYKQLALYDAIEILAINLGVDYHTVDMNLRRALQRATQFAGCLKEFYEDTMEKIFSNIGYDVPAKDDSAYITEELAKAEFGKGYRRKFRVMNAKEMFKKVREHCDEVINDGKAEEFDVEGCGTYEGRREFEAFLYKQIDDVFD